MAGIIPFVYWSMYALFNGIFVSAEILIKKRSTKYTKLVVKFFPNSKIEARRVSNLLYDAQGIVYSNECEENCSSQ